MHIDGQGRPVGPARWKPEDDGCATEANMDVVITFPGILKRFLIEVTEVTFSINAGDRIPGRAEAYSERAKKTR